MEERTLTNYNFCLDLGFPGKYRRLTSNGEREAINRVYTARFYSAFLRSLYQSDRRTPLIHPRLSLSPLASYSVHRSLLPSRLGAGLLQAFENQALWEFPTNPLAEGVSVYPKARFAPVLSTDVFSWVKTLVRLKVLQ